jgi:hypothetical protein
LARFATDILADRDMFRFRLYDAGAGISEWGHGFAVYRLQWPVSTLEFRRHPVA